MLGHDRKGECSLCTYSMAFGRREIASKHFNHPRRFLADHLVDNDKDLRNVAFEFVV